LAISLNAVIPAKAGIQSVVIHLKFLDSRFRGNDESNLCSGDSSVKIYDDGGRHTAGSTEGRPMTKQWTQVSCEVPETMVDEISAYLLELAPDGVITENLELDTFSLDSLEGSPTSTVTVYFEANESLEANIAHVRSFLSKVGPSFPGFSFKEPLVVFLNEEDWGNSWKEHFKPARIGKRLVIKPTWEKFHAEREDIILQLDPGMAFGTGTHPSTRFCLEILEKIYFHEGIFIRQDEKKPSTVLDVGTGSGILSIAAAKLGAREVTAIDIDPQAVMVAAENLMLNGVEQSVLVSATPISSIECSFDLIVANILAEALVNLAPELVKRINPGGFLILSGILTEKEQTVLDCYSAFAFTLMETKREGEWSCLTFCRET
jgi:ribosomal protein L11 methyltransferase